MPPPPRRAGDVRATSHRVPRADPPPVGAAPGRTRGSSRARRTARRSGTIVVAARAPHRAPSRATPIAAPATSGTPEAGRPGSSLGASPSANGSRPSVRATASASTSEASAVTPIAIRNACSTSCFERRWGLGGDPERDDLAEAAGETAPSSTADLSFGVPIITPGRRAANGRRRSGYHRRARTWSGPITCRRVEGRGDATARTRIRCARRPDPSRARRAAGSGRGGYRRSDGERAGQDRPRTSLGGGARGQSAPGVRSRARTARLGAARGPGIRERSQARGRPPRRGTRVPDLPVADPARAVPRERSGPGDRALGGRPRRPGEGNRHDRGPRGCDLAGRRRVGQRPVVAPGPRRLPHHLGGARCLSGGAVGERAGVGGPRPSWELAEGVSRGDGLRPAGSWRCRPSSRS